VGFEGSFLGATFAGGMLVGSVGAAIAMSPQLCEGRAGQAVLGRRFRDRKLCGALAVVQG